MRFRLVIHVPEKAALARGALAEIEGALARVLAPEHSIHGHDLGRGHLILTIHSDDPEATWETAKAVIPEPTLSTTYVFYTPLEGPQAQGAERWLWPLLDDDVSPRRD